MTLKTTFAIGAVFALCIPASAAVLHTESFESPPGAGYTLNTAFDDGSFDFFDRYAVPDNANAARDDFQNGWDGSFGIIGQDHDGDGGAATTTIDIPGINISGSVDLAARILFGALNSEPTFNNYEASAGDGIEIFSDIDGGGPVLIGAFKPNATGIGDLYLDGDLNGVGEGTKLTIDLASFTFLIPGVGNSLDLSIALTSTDSFEPLAVDNVRVLDNVPEPATLALMFVGLAGLAIRRRL
jgi:hypothetical protein